MPVSAPHRPSPGTARRQPYLTAATTPDATLVTLAAGGDERAFELLFQRHRADVLAYATRMLRDHGRAEDVVQDVFVSAVRAIVGAPADQRPVHVRAWLREIARRACIDQWRGATRRGEVSLDAPDRLRASDAFRLADHDSLSRATDDREAVSTLRRAFDDLPELQAAVLVQRELEGRSIAEIAARLELTPTVVEGQLARGRRALGQAYRELESGERCISVRALCDASVGGRLGVRDRHRVGRHVRGCDGCRRYARASGVDAHLVHGSVLARASFLLPLPLLRRLPVDHAVAGEAAGTVAGTKVLVGAAVIAAGGGGTYVSKNVVPPLTSSPPASSQDAGRDATASGRGLQRGPGGEALLRIPGVSGIAPGLVLPLARGTDGVRTVSPFTPPWLLDETPDARATPSSHAAERPATLPPTPAAPAPAPAVPVLPEGRANDPVTPTAPSSPTPAERTPSRDQPILPAAPAGSSSGGTQGPATPGAAPAAPGASSDDAPASTGASSAAGPGTASSDDAAIVPTDEGATDVAPAGPLLADPAAADPAPAEPVAAGPPQLDPAPADPAPVAAGPGLATVELAPAGAASEDPAAPADPAPGPAAADSGTAGA